MDFLKNEVSVWDNLRNSKKPILLYGMGNGADKVIDEATRLGINISGVFASDSFVRGQGFRGYTVKKLSDFIKEYDDFIVAVAFASQLPEVIDNILSISEKYETYVPCVPVYGNEILNNEFIMKYESEILKAYELLADDLSKEVYIGAIKFQFTGKLKYLQDITTDKDEAFNNILKLTNNESYLDLGAYRGDTITEFLNYTNNSYNYITALEPDKRTYKKLENFCADLQNINTINKAISSTAGLKYFSDNKGRGTSLQNNGNTIVETTTLDELSKSETFSYIKADVEGAEYDMLLGATQFLQKHSPKLNIAAYHHCKDIFELPIMLHSINNKYKIHLRKHPYIPCWDLNIYAKVND